MGATRKSGFLYVDVLISKFGADLFFKFFREVLLIFFPKFSHFLVDFDGEYYYDSFRSKLAKIMPKTPFFGFNLGRGGHIASAILEWWFLHQFNPRFKNDSYLYLD